MINLHNHPAGPFTRADACSNPSPEAAGNLRELHLAAQCCGLRALLFRAERRIAELHSNLKFGGDCVNSMGAAIKRMKEENAALKRDNAALTAALHRANR